MPKRTSIGVDIGSSAVRAAEVVIDGKSSELVRFAQVGLPPGAVVEGEVRDQAGVAAALKRLWSEGGFRSRDVVLGVSSQRAMVRLIEMPAIADKQLRSALRYEIGDLLPIPLDQAVFDFAVLGPGRPKGDGGQTTQVLVVVAQKDIVWDEIAVAKRAGLRVRAVDASPLALLRAVPPAETSDALDAVVSLGAHLVVAAIRQGSTPRFMRTATVAEDAEAPARTVAGSRFAPVPGRDKPEARGPGAKSGPIIEEVRSSIEFFLSHAQGAVLERVQLTGGGALTPGLADRLAAALGIPVVPASVAPKCEASTLALSEVQFREASLRWTTAVGLALWGSEGANPSLLPPEIEEKRRERSTMVLAAAGVVVIAAGLGVMSHGRTGAIAKVKQQITVDQHQAAALEAEIGKLGAFPQAQSDVAARRALGASALSNDIDWVGLDHRIERALPNGVQATSISFMSTAASSTASPQGPSASGTTSAGSYVGTVSISAQTTGGLPSVAEFVDNITAVPGVGAAWVFQSESGQANQGSAAPGTKGGHAANVEMSFNVSAEVTSAALSHRASELPGGDQ